eukprot:6225838-Amphidinium_carterae.1
MDFPHAMTQRVLRLVGLRNSHARGTTSPCQLNALPLVQLAGAWVCASVCLYWNAAKHLRLYCAHASRQLARSITNIPLTSSGVQAEGAWHNTLHLLSSDYGVWLGIVQENPNLPCSNF